MFEKYILDGGLCGLYDRDKSVLIELPFDDGEKHFWNFAIAEETDPKCTWNGTISKAENIVINFTTKKEESKSCYRDTRCRFYLLDNNVLEIIRLGKRYTFDLHGGRFMAVEESSHSEGRRVYIKEVKAYEKI